VCYRSLPGYLLLSKRWTALAASSSVTTTFEFAIASNLVSRVAELDLLMGVKWRLPAGPAARLKAENPETLCSAPIFADVG
jgi:hypothetical protein